MAYPSYIYNMPSDNGFEASMDISTAPVLGAVESPSFLGGLGDYLSKGWGSMSSFTKDGFIPGKGVGGALTNPYLMQGITGLGNLGLGLASYFQQKPLLEAQKNALNQNIAFAKEDQARQRKNYESATRWAPPTQGRL